MAIKGVRCRAAQGTGMVGEGQGPRPRLSVCRLGCEANVPSCPAIGPPPPSVSEWKSPATGFSPGIRGTSRHLLRRPHTHPLTGGHLPGPRLPVASNRKGSESKTNVYCPTCPTRGTKDKYVGSCRFLGARKNASQPRPSSEERGRLR